MGSALFVKRATKSETEKKITTVKDASALPKSPGVPRSTVEAIIDSKLSAIDGMSAPRHMALLDSAISIRQELSSLQS